MKYLKGKTVGLRYEDNDELNNYYFFPFKFTGSLHLLIVLFVYILL